LTRGSGPDRTLRPGSRTSGGPLDPRVKPEDDGVKPEDDGVKPEDDGVKPRTTEGE
jgi:hypothetical protein